MASISKALHRNLIKEIKEFLRSTADKQEGSASLHQELSHLQTIFEKYQLKLAEIFEVIDEYDRQHKNVKFTFKKHLSQNKKMLKSVDNISPGKESQRVLKVS